ncbi:hypothetical protein AgCh_026066 [Apium graveolens]
MLPRVNELEIQHLAANILVLAGKAQQEEIGDGANLTVSFAGELLQKAEEYIRMVLYRSENIIGYTKTIISFQPWSQTIVILNELIENGSDTMDVRLGTRMKLFYRMRSVVPSQLS